MSLNEDGTLGDATTSYTSIFIENVGNTEHSRSTNQRSYHFTYDGQGFLKQQISITSYIAKSKGNIWYGNGFFHEISSITTETTDYTYASEKVISTSAKSLNVFIGNKQSPVETTSASTRTYQYDSNGKPMSFTEKFSNGDMSVSTYSSGVITSNTYTSNNGTKHTKNYNALGLLIEDNLGHAVYKLAYDAKGNLASVEQVLDNVSNYIQEFKYDDHPNPETLIPTEFKGIPDPIVTIQLSDGKRTNNLIEEKYTSYQNNPNSLQKYTHSYLATGYPETTTISQDNNARVTTYKYQDCQ